MGGAHLKALDASAVVIVGQPLSVVRPFAMIDISNSSKS